MTFPDFELTYIEFTFVIKLPYQICRLARVHWTGKNVYLNNLHQSYSFITLKLIKLSVPAENWIHAKTTQEPRIIDFCFILRVYISRENIEKKSILNTNKYLKEMRVHLVGLFQSKPHKMFVLGLHDVQYNNLLSSYYGRRLSHSFIFLWIE